MHPPDIANGESGAAKPPEPLRDVQVGPYVLEVGSDAGTTVRPVAATGQDAALDEALAGEEADREPAPSAAESVEELVDEASATTGRIERAIAFGSGVAEGKALEQLGLEAGTLIDLLERLDRRGEHEEALRLARALAKLWTLLRRWRALLELLRVAEKLGDLKAVGWAKHELGTLQLAAGRVEGAERRLAEAQEIRRTHGDRLERAVTDRNLQVLCRRLREMLREEQLVRRDDRSRVRRLLPLAGVAALLLAVGVAGGVVAAGDDDPGPDGRNGGTATTDPNGSGNGGGNGGDIPQPPEEEEEEEEEEPPIVE